jgi:hypothetical protein
MSLCINCQQKELTGKQTKFCSQKCYKLYNQKNNRIKYHNKYTKKYEKTIGGFLMRLYRNMLSRVCGIQRFKKHLYFGKEILGKNDFYTWAKNNNEFLRLYNVWKENNYDRKLTPTVDRIDSNQGYILSNMRWLNHSDNSRLGTLHRNQIYNHERRSTQILKG